MGKKNADPRCQRPKDCAAKGDGACRRCACSAHMRKMHQDPAFAKARDERSSKVLKAKFADPAFRARHRLWVSENAKRLNARPEVKLAASARIRANETIRERTRERWRDEEWRAQAIAKFKARVQTDAVRAKRKRALQRTGHILSHQHEIEIAVRAATTSDTYAEIGADYLIGAEWAGEIARKWGVYRQRCHAASRSI